MNTEIFLREALNYVETSLYPQYSPYTQDTDNFLMSRGRNFGRGEDAFVYRTVWELWATQYHSRVLCRYNEFAIGATENRINYVTGEDGFGVEAAARYPHDKEAYELAKRVQDFVEVFEEVNSTPELQSESMLRLDEDGEFFLRHFYRKDGMTILRMVEPEHISAPMGDTLEPTYSFGIETPKDDIQTTLAYWVCERPYLSSIPTRIEERDIVHGKLNSRSTAKRGYPTFIPVAPNFRRCEDLLGSMTQIARTRAKIALIRKMSGVDSATAADLVSRLTARTRTNASTANVENIEQYSPGSILTTNLDYEFPDFKFGASDFVEVLQAELRAIAVRFAMPEWMFTALADAKYSNAFIAEAPAMKAFGRLQRKLHRIWITGRVGQKRSVYWRAIAHAVRCGILPPDVMTRVKLIATGPTILARDAQQEASVNQTYSNMGVKDATTIQRQQGLDPDEIHNNRISMFKEGKLQFNSDTMKQLVEYLGGMSAGQIELGAGYSLIALSLGLPVELVTKAFPVKEKPPEQSPAVPNAPPLGKPSKQSLGVDIPVKESEKFDENKHPRADDGKFGSGGGGSTGKDESKKDESKKDESKKDVQPTKVPIDEKTGYKYDPNPKLPDATRPPADKKILEAISKYSDMYYEPLNKSLRDQGEAPDTLKSWDDSGDINGKELFDNLQKAFQAVKPFKPPVTVMRGIRASGDIANQIKQTAKAAIGKGTMKMPGFISTTTSKEVAGDFGQGVQFIIQASHGIDMRPVSEFPDENEMLLNHNSEFQVNDVLELGEKTVIYLKQIVK